MKTTGAERALAVVLWIAAAAVGCGAPEAPRSEAAITHAAASPAPHLGRAPAIYRVSVVEAGQGLAVSLSLAHASPDRTVDLPYASDRPQRRANVDDVRCGDRPVPRSEDGWAVGGDCSELSYRVGLRPPPDAGLHPRHLAATYDAERNQWLVPGSSVFLSPPTQSERPALELRAPPEVPIHHALAGASRLGVQLPPRRSLGRVLLGFGSFPTAERSDGRTIFFHHFDVADAVPLEGIEAGVDYVQAVTGLRPASEVHVYWLGRDSEDSPRLTGANYSNAVVVNYARDLADDAPASRVRAPLAVFFHQFFVSLVGPNAPEWLSQSLGQYFALKAWQRAGVIDEAGLAALLRTGAATTPDETVLEAHARFRQEETTESWSRFYRLALGFWLALDSHLEGATNGETRLDDVAGELIGLFYDDEGRPRCSFSRSSRRSVPPTPLPLLVSGWSGRARVRSPPVPLSG